MLLLDLQLPFIPAPIIEWGSFTYYAFSFIDNRLSYCVIAYDVNNQVAYRKEILGYRY
jgi:hypothetical protein